ncbi:hypothetical protein Xmau_00915 [Xenorhabdus mauleonii]|uniref:Baseplate J-like protein n=1 Tax=Xenorhabdus mauleonii TaxID=351675 RepID=A0A1I3LQN2_9GAMM|nr:hypothetical protein [Xenorhabdus mauleonii]PHM45265.1 hypothetical protein Xmau_00915 [Xenorhabdus mauleonii]SFI86776.1 hypothetical protein SAMN05421680_10432 [Xenorhabdus mauleonii]
MGQAELEEKLAAIVPETEFKLDERSTLDILTWLKEYAALIPFDKDKEQFWDGFYFIQENDPQKLTEIYHNTRQADGLLPPHQTFVLAFLKLLETTKTLLNTFPARHRHLYYRELLGLKPREAQADSVALGIVLNKEVKEYFLPKGTHFEAGQDSAGNPLQYASESGLLANQGKLTDLRWHRKGTDHVLSAIPLNLADNKIFPENGMRLFEPTLEEVPVLSGYLVASPLLAMSGGERCINIRLAETVKEDATLIQAQVSSGNHWLPLAVVKEGEDTLNLYLPADADPITPPNNLDGMTFDVPVLKLGTAKQRVLPEIAEITVNIKSHHGVLYSSDYGIEQTDSTSFPFGQSPSSGAGFNLIAPEWYGTENATLTITPQWNDLPEKSFKTWYQGYESNIADVVFNVQGYLITPQARKALGNAQPLFSSNNNQAPQGQSLTFTLPQIDYPVANSISPREWPASIRVELVQDFGHAQYWNNPAGKNIPYTPQISMLQVQFSAKATPAQFVIYPLTPFGWGEPAKSALSLNNDTFYLGFTDVLPGQTLSLYWQLTGFKPLQLSWSYLNQENIWCPLDKWVDDQTRHLFDRGLWRALLPHDASNQATQMPAGRYWLKAEIQKQVEIQNYPIIKGMLYNSTTATLINPESVAQAHFINGLAANSIKQQVNAPVEVSNIIQPWAPWNGRPQETESDFLTRVPARLSHRNRVLSWGNMATLLKDHFVSVFDVQTPSAGELTKIPAPEVQQLVVIPENHYKDNDDALRPTLNSARLTEMGEWLMQLSSPWATIDIKNPAYVDVYVQYELAFVADVNPDYAHYQLQQELSRQYMPWAENSAIGVITGTHIDYYQLLATIQQSPFVERVTDLKIKRSDSTTNADAENIQAADNEVLILVWRDKIQGVSHA